MDALLFCEIKQLDNNKTNGIVKKVMHLDIYNKSHFRIHYIYIL